MLHSLLSHEAGSIEVHLFVDSDVPPGVIEQLATLFDGRGGASLSVMPIPYGLIGDLIECAPATTWTRMFLAEALDRVERAIYLDCDVIVLDALRPLWSIQLGDAHVAAVTTVFPGTAWGEAHCAAMGICNVRRYFNGGVLVMDLNSLRLRGFSSAAVDFAQAHRSRSLILQAIQDGNHTDELRAYARDHPSEMLFADQDAMNAVLSDRRLALHPRWNCMNQTRLPDSKAIYGVREVQEALNSPAIRHFEGVGASKPWEPGSDANDRELYVRHRNRTPWPL
jgi:lipopolysaccharide biosynthesis glycosyltransferase